MPKRIILVPVDGTDFSYRIFPTLTSLLKASDYEIVLLTVQDRVTGHVGSPPRTITADGSIKSYETAADFEYAAHPIYASQERDSALAEFISDTKPHAAPLVAAGFTVDYQIRFGDVPSEILDYLASNPVDMIAMATHWRRGLDRLFNGNTLTGILPRVDIPLLVIRSDEE